MRFAYEKLIGRYSGREDLAGRRGEQECADERKNCSAGTRVNLHGGNLEVGWPFRIVMPS